MFLSQQVIKCLLCFWSIETLILQLLLIRWDVYLRVILILLPYPHFASIKFCDFCDSEKSQNSIFAFYQILTKITIVKFNTRYTHIHKILRNCHCLLLFMIKILILSLLYWGQSYLADILRIDKSNILQFYLAPKIAKLNTRKIWLMIFTRNLLLQKLSDNKVLIFFIVLLLSGILSRVHSLK